MAAATPTPSNDKIEGAWYIPVAGIAFLCISLILRLVLSLDDIPGDQIPGASFAAVGIIGVCGGMAALAVVERRLSFGARVALLGIAGFLLVQASLLLGL